MLVMSLSLSFCNVNVLQRDNRALCTLNEGFSVVAPISVTVPFSTGPRKTSCWLLLNLERESVVSLTGVKKGRTDRWISSQNIIVFLPARPSSLLASAKIFLHSTTPELVLFISMKRLPTILAITLAMIVLPVPALPQRIIFGALSCSIKPRGRLILLRLGASNLYAKNLNLAIVGLQLYT